MKLPHILTAAHIGVPKILTAVTAAAAIFLGHTAMAGPIMVDLGTAGDFSILGYSGITDAGGVSTIKGDVGLSPTTGAAITGLTAGHVNGTIYTVDGTGPGGNIMDAALLTTAKNDLSTAFTYAAGLTGTAIAGGDNQLGGKTLISGVYSVPAASTANLLGALTLDAQGDPDAVFIIQFLSSLVTGSASSVQLINGAQACHVFWVVNSSATLGTYTDFVGNIMAYASIGLDTGATLNGSALAENGAVTLDHNSITHAVCATSSVPDGGSTLTFLGLGLVSLLGLKKVSTRHGLTA